MRLRTRLTERFDIEHPIISAPMGMIAGGRLAAAVSNAGGLGLIGGGYGDGGWLEREFSAAGNAQSRMRLHYVVAGAAAGIARSGAGKATCRGDAVVRAGRCFRRADQAIRRAGDLPGAVDGACQREAVGAGAEVIVAQGGEAGGHSGSRSTFTLVSEVADYLAKTAPDTLLVAAGGVADGRSLAAALMLGADGVLIGSRLVASSEALTPQGFHDAIIAADGDATIKTSVIDLVRNYHWPGEFSGRALKNGFVSEVAWQRECLDRRFAHWHPKTERYWTAFTLGRRRQRRRVHGRGGGID